MSDEEDNASPSAEEETCEQFCSPRYVYDADPNEGPCDPCTGRGSNSTNDNAKPELVVTYFQDGPLGVNLYRRPEDGIVEVTGILPNTQAVEIDVRVGDELWGVGSIEMANNYIEQEAWQGIVEYIKQSVRPLEVTWRRTNRSVDNLAARIPSQDSRQVSRDATQSPPIATPSSPSSTFTPKHGAQHEVENAEEPTEEGDEEEPAPAHQPSANYKILEGVLASLVKKPSSGKENYKADFHYKYLLQEDRRLLRRGELSTPGAPTLWMKTYLKKHIILLSDLVIITTPQTVHKMQCYVVEHIIDLQTCKLRSDGQVFGGAMDSKSGPANPNAVTSPTHSKDRSQADKQLLESAFQLIWPGGSMQLFADSKESKEVWVLNLFLAICARVGGENNGQGQVLGWRHQYMLGTMHSAVLSHDEQHVRELVALCDAGEMEFSACIDAADEDGYTPLHYACIMRMHGIIRALHEAAADVTAQDHRGLTPLHWAAMQLDDYTLSLLCSHVFDLDLCDKLQRTPLYMACVEGRDVAGHTDQAALKKCVACMLTHQPNVNFYDQAGFTMCHYLAASWQYEALDLLLQADADVNARAARSGMTALHLACQAQPLKFAEGEAKRIMQGGDITASTGGSSKGTALTGSGSAGGVGSEGPVYEKLNHPMGPTTLRTLLKAGARPNMRDSKGRSPLVILAEPGRDDLWDLMELTDGVSVLLSFGARFDDSPAVQALRHRLVGINIEALMERWASLPVINGDALNITINQFKRGDAPVSEATSSSQKVSRTRSADSGGKGGPGKGAAGPSSPSASTTSKNPQGDKEGCGYPAPVFPEMTDKCSLCWFQFSLFRRVHHCRLCDALCCDECSKKRVLVEYQQVRTCDGCYNRVMDLQEKKNREEMLARMKPIPKARGDASKLYLEERAKLMAEASQDGGADGEGKVGRGARGNTAQTINVLSETHEKLLERGEKLNRLNDRSELMANQANDFAKMAKALNEQQKNRWF